jgi:hypothetical protein
MFSRTGLLWRLMSMGMVATGVVVMLSVVLLAMPDSDEVFETQIGSGMEPTIDSGTSVDGAQGVAKRISGSRQRR